jgi:hypothetical protein
VASAYIASFHKFAPYKRVAVADSLSLERFNAVARFTIVLNQSKNGLLCGATMAKARNCGERQTWCRCGVRSVATSKRRAWGKA